jgi:hypothetical protein
VVGLVWIQQFTKEPDLPKLEAGALRGITDLRALPLTDPRRIYAERVNVRDPRLLDAMDTYSRHFLGSIVSVKGKRWGVLLLDSTEAACPYAASRKGNVEKDFRQLAKHLSNILD